MAIQKRYILVLHGYAQNAYMISRRVSLIKKECDDDLDFLYLDGPNVILPPEPADRNIETPAPILPVMPVYENCSRPTRTPTYSDTPRGWWLMQYTIRPPTPGLEISLQVLKEAFMEYQFEAIIGFSQGAAFAEQVCAMLESPHNYPFFCDERGQPLHPPLKYLVLNSGFLLRGPLMAWDAGVPEKASYDETPVIHTPVLHVLGRNDVVVVRERSDIFMTFSKNKRLIQHDGGHFIPTQLRWRKFLAEVLRGPLAYILSSPSQDDDHRPTPSSQNLTSDPDVSL